MPFPDHAARHPPADLPDETIVPLSRGKTVLRVLGSFAFVAFAAWLLTAFDDPRRQAVGALGIAVFGLFAAVGLRKLFDRRPGLRIGPAGIFDNASGVSAGLIPWADVAGFHVYEVQRQRMVVVEVRPVERYVKRGGPFRRMVNRANAALCGSPVVIPDATLRLRFDELLALLVEYRAKYGR